jgi:transposase
MESIKKYVGIDVSKLNFDVAIELAGTYRSSKLPNTLEGFSQLLGLLDSNSHVVMEASGPYYVRLASYLHEQGFIVSVVNPLVIRRFCQMRLSRAKTDKKDAKMIAEYGKVEHPQAWTPSEGYLQELRQLQAASDLLDKSRTSLLRQQEAFDQLPIQSKDASKAIQKAIRMLEKELTGIESKMQQLITEHHGDLYKRLQSIPGLGKKTSLLLIVLSGGFTRFSKSRQLSSYIGLCPRIYESGTSVKGRGRITKMGMSRVRAMLYLCTWSAKRCNKACKELYERLVAKGKSKRLALIAVANKLLLSRHRIPYIRKIT